MILMNIIIISSIQLTHNLYIPSLLHLLVRNNLYQRRIKE